MDGRADAPPPAKATPRLHLRLHASCHAPSPRSPQPQLGVGVVLVTTVLWLRGRSARRAFARRHAQLMSPADEHWLAMGDSGDGHLALLGLPLVGIELWVVLVAFLAKEGQPVLRMVA